MSETQQSRSREPLEKTRSRAKERAQRAAQKTAGDAREELGRLAFDALEDYFPEEAKERRQGNRFQFIAAGFALGFLVRHVLSRRARRER